MKNYTPKWKKLPRSIVKEYQDGKTIFELSVKHNTDTGSMRKALLNFKTKMRPPGGRIIGRSRGKLTESELSQILQMDDNNVPHVAIARFFSKGGKSITRERIRQICIQAGHATRASRINPSGVTQQEALRIKRVARKEAKARMVEAVSKAWKSGAGRDEISYAMFGELKSRHYINSRLVQLRNTYGERMFPYKQPNHWAKLTLDQREARIREISRVWQETGDIYELVKRFGYAGYNSAMSMIIRYSKRYPHLFPTREQMLRERLKNEKET